MIPYPRSSIRFRTAFALIFGTMMPITFFVFSSSDGASVRANAADLTPMDPSIARAIAIRASATLYFSTRFDRTAFARSRTRKNSTINASCFSFRSLCPRSAVRRVRRNWRRTDRVGLYWTRTIYAGTFRSVPGGAGRWAGWYFSSVLRSTFVSHASSRVARSFHPISSVCSIVRSSSEPCRMNSCSNRSANSSILRSRSESASFPPLAPNP